MGSETLPPKYHEITTGALNGVGKDELLSSEIYSPVPGYFQRCPLAPEIDAIARGEYKAKQPPDIVGTTKHFRSEMIQLYGVTQLLVCPA